jgi:hypothetical protein
VTLPEWAAPEPVTEKANFVTWEGAEVDRAIRFLVPSFVYPPGETAPVPVPEDYLAYLLAQSDDGAVFEDVVDTTIDGRPATVLTATTPTNLDDSIGCTAEGNLVADCFGLLADLTLRMAVVDTDQGPLLIWVRDARDGNGAPEYDTFDAMLTSLQFRPATTPSEGADTTVPAGSDPQLPEGDYRTPELTRDQLVAAGVNAGFAENDVQAWLDAALPGFEGTIAWGLRLGDGAWSQYQIVNAGPLEIGSRGTYELVDDDTMIATEAPPYSCRTTSSYELDGQQLRLDVINSTCPDGSGPDNLLVLTFIFETAPFTLQ